MDISKNILTLGALLLASPVEIHAAETSKPASKPNILIILVDDMGYSDLGCFGSEIKTPNLDRLAAGGIKFTQMYNTAKCYPTRASLLTGAYFQRTDLDFSKTATLGEVLQPAGYHTWWTGKNHAHFNPVTRGFEHYYGMIGGAENHFNPGDKPIAPGQPAPASKGKGATWADDAVEMKRFTPKDPKFYDTDAFTDRALQWLDKDDKDGKPFLLYVAYTAPQGKGRGMTSSREWLAAPVGGRAAGHANRIESTPYRRVMFFAFVQWLRVKFLPRSPGSLAFLQNSWLRTPDKDRPPVQVRIRVPCLTQFRPSQ